MSRAQREGGLSSGRLLAQQDQAAACCSPAGGRRSNGARLPACPPAPPLRCRLEGGQPEQRRESSLKFQTRCVRCFSDGQGYATSSVEGRVAMEWFDTSEDAQVGHGALTAVLCCCRWGGGWYCKWGKLGGRTCSAALARSLSTPSTRPLGRPPTPRHPPARQARKYAFKCHRRSEGGRDLVYPVNALAFNPAWGTFATGGARARA